MGRGDSLLSQANQIGPRSSVNIRNFFHQNAKNRKPFLQKSSQSKRSCTRNLIATGKPYQVLNRELLCSPNMMTIRSFALLISRNESTSWRVSKNLVLSFGKLTYAGQQRKIKRFSALLVSLKGLLLTAPCSDD
jgi:hypothetical protein